jgi:hypothetical protein
MQDPHTVNFPIPSVPQEPISFMPDAKGQPHVALGDALIANVKSGDEFNPDARSGALMGGDSFTMTFTRKGIYTYFCAIHPNMIGAIEVQPPQPPPYAKQGGPAPTEAATPAK